MTNYNFNSIKFNLEYGLGGKPVSRGLFQFYQFSLIPCQATKITWQELFLCALLILIIKRHHHIRQLLFRFFQSSCPFIHRNHITRTAPAVSSMINFALGLSPSSISLVRMAPAIWFALSLTASANVSIRLKVRA